jgi:vacuolar-type H+-ATPase subunit E/Vma4
MALDDLLAAMREEADSELAQIEREAAEEEAAIHDRACREAQALEEQSDRDVTGQLDAEAGRRLALARLDSRRCIREAQERAFREALDASLDRLCELRGEARGAELLADLIHESRRALPDAGLLRVDPRDEGAARKALGEADVEVRADLEPTAGGVLLEDGEGRTVRNTLEHRLEAAESALRLRFAAMIDERAREHGQ